ncbi:MAG: magnesium transporter CorA family protein, partial [Dehalococcoidia bacterium]|nr:magnesium transporter CorA family protein [Dehalococcoidia bacterium]
MKWYKSLGRLGADNTAKKSTDNGEPLHIEQAVHGDLTWLNIEKPTRRELDYLAQEFHFHPLDLDDCLSRIQRPKIDEYEEYLFIVFHFPLFRKEAGVTVASQVAIFIGENYLVTIHDGVLKPLVKLFTDCQTNEAAREANMKSSGYLLYRITDTLVDYCLPIANKIMQNLETVEDEIFDTRRIGRVARKLSLLRRDVISNRRVIWSMKAVISSLEHKTARYTTEDLEVFWGDVIDHVDKTWDTLDECKEIIEGLHAAQDSVSSQHTNETMRVLTVIATIMMPLTLVASIYGMNIALPRIGHESSLVSF